MLDFVLELVSKIVENVCDPRPSEFIWLLCGLVVRCAVWSESVGNIVGVMWCQCQHQASNTTAPLH